MTLWVIITGCAGFCVYGNCENDLCVCPDICPAVYSPICAELLAHGETYKNKTFSNWCNFQVMNCPEVQYRYIAEGECEGK